MYAVQWPASEVRVGESGRQWEDLAARLAGALQVGNCNIDTV